MSLDLNQLETRLWAAADQLWANTGLKPSEFSNPVLGLIFLRYAERRFHEAEARMLESGLDVSEIEKIDYQAEGALFLPDNARFSYLLDLDFVRVALLKNRNLRATRDLLLPKLISGELDVSTLSEPVREMEAAA